ncbi:MAG: energy-coupling factor transporter ATPase [Clostridiales bacterium]|nr:energy-coupling factor transporter ATPase [Clostridiales bacterium]
MRIVLEKVGYEYQQGSPFSAVALKDIDLTIREGEFVALIGHTGSGKSTLAQHLNGLIRPTQGTVYYEDEEGRADIHGKGYSKKSLRRQVGLVFQYPEYQLFEETVQKDVAFGPKNLGLDKDEIDARVKEAITRVGLDYDAVAEKSPFELSGGQMRRVAIAGVVAMRPGVLVLDEPTAGLDPGSREELLQMIKGLHDSGTTIVMISHNMDDVARYAGRIVVMQKGTVVMDGTPREIFSRGEELERMGLDVPQSCRLSLMLRKDGFPDFPLCYRPEEVTEALEKLLGGEGRAC